MQVLAQPGQYAHRPRVLVTAGELRRPVAERIDDPSHQYQVNRPVQNSHACPEAVVETLPQREPQVTGLILVVNVHLLVQRGRAHFK